jgi:hypothetical protein
MSPSANLLGLRSWSVPSVFPWQSDSDWLDIVKGSAPSERNEDMFQSQSSVKNNDDGGTPSVGVAFNVGATEADSCEKPSHRQGRCDRLQTSQAEPPEKKKWAYAYMLFKTSLEEEAIWHIYLLPGNCTTAAITWQQLCKQACLWGKQLHSKKRMVFCVVRAEML